MNLTLPLRAEQTVSDWEFGFVSPANASARSGLTPFQLRNLAIVGIPEIGSSPIIRSIHSRSRLLFRLDDVLLVARWLTEGRLVLNQGSHPTEEGHHAR